MAISFFMVVLLGSTRLEGGDGRPRIEDRAAAEVRDLDVEHDGRDVEVLGEVRRARRRVEQVDPVVIGDCALGEEAITAAGRREGRRAGVAARRALTEQTLREERAHLEEAVDGQVAGGSALTR